MNAVEKTLNIIEALMKHNGEMSITELVKATGQSIGTTHRICSILARRGYIYQKGKGDKYSLGFKFLLFNDVTHAGKNMKAQALPFLKELSEKISETVVMTVFDGVEPIDVISIVPDNVLKASPGLGTKSPFHCTAVGKVFLANSSPEMIEKTIYSQDLVAYTEQTITDPRRLKVEIDAVRREGVAFDDEEYILGVRSAAAPIKVENGDVLAVVCFIAPSTRVSVSKMKQLAPFVQNCALVISRALGYRGRETVLESMFLSDSVNTFPIEH